MSILIKFLIPLIFIELFIGITVTYFILKELILNFKLQEKLLEKNINIIQKLKIIFPIKGEKEDLTSIKNLLKNSSLIDQYKVNDILFKIKETQKRRNIFLFLLVTNSVFFVVIVFVYKIIKVS